MVHPFPQPSMTWFENLPMGRHAPGDSRIHRLDPRAKLLAVGLILSGSFLKGSAAGLLSCLPLVFYGLWASGVGFGTVARGFYPVWGLLAFSALLHAFTTPGVSLWPSPILGVAWTREGWVLGLKAAAQLALAMGCASLLTLTTSPEGLVAGLSRLFAPFRRLGLPVEEFYNSVHIALRMLPLLGRELDATVAHRSSGETFVNTLEALLRRLLRDARELRDEVRDCPPPELGPFGAADWAAVGLSIASLAAAFWASRGVGA